VHTLRGSHFEDDNERQTKQTKLIV